MNILIKDILTVKRGVICQQVNARGYMGAGLALDIRTKWPIVYTQYAFMTPRLGEVQKVVVDSTATLWVFNLCAQAEVGPGLQTSYDSLERCLEHVAIQAHALPIFIPWKMGCGLGGGDWDVVVRSILKHLVFATICIKP